MDTAMRAHGLYAYFTDCGKFYTRSDANRRAGRVGRAVAWLLPSTPSLNPLERSVDFWWQVGQGVPEIFHKLKLLISRIPNAVLRFTRARGAKHHAVLDF